MIAVRLVYRGRLTSKVGYLRNTTRSPYIEDQTFTICMPASDFLTSAHFFATVPLHTQGECSE